ncbi:helix-turn-helix domain-containing protein [Anaerosalibacter bizertensis]|uniref:Helix-turn-helix domain-containing protein n=1 Tax=Anaerosalibacter bizertensis TaxID=932217 RepID=A0A9Q4ADP4_9FIRM|nr:helix-turn-helix domain-containing protein [Anaerosalibacter bizertensis]MBV1818935.1 helix-turn-helix domain-containing protein [Bacteroidales bacterium MSK.15.36]MBU5292627.1 helix-turn-helix domain-containing protein [Anaerosalibacter bizertensis]MCB5559540.1 helix-turn-helix domain-containing protein [Anaerosalibacter bizertensis]MCG4565710.1 helix-turn-helix domain-containing protein [Anaerosalibacter bizertensis]MCG4582819.1 helix-turn-helix domain-containing protein [Anaerosalibacter
MRSKGFNAYTKYTILQHALKGNNVSQTCELFGISRTTFYNWKNAYEKHGMAGLDNRERRKPKMPNKVSKDIEQEILSYVTKYPADGPKRIYYELISQGFDIGETGIYNVLKRYNLTRKAQRIEYSMDEKSHINIKKRDKKDMSIFSNAKDSYPGYLVIQRIDFIGTFEGIGRIYQYSFYDTVSRWGEVKIYNKKQDIDIWHYFERKLIYLLETFSLNIENLVTEKEREFLPYFVKGNKYKEILEDFNINHIFISPEYIDILDGMREFNEFLMMEFYNKIPLNDKLDSFVKVEAAINDFIRKYNFHSIIPNGPKAGKTPAEVVLERAIENGADLDTLPLWLLALINYSK